MEDKRFQQDMNSYIKQYLVTVKENGIIEKIKLSKEMPGFYKMIVPETATEDKFGRFNGDTNPEEVWQIGENLIISEPVFRLVIEHCKELVEGIELKITGKGFEIVKHETLKLTEKGLDCFKKDK